MRVTTQMINASAAQAGLNIHTASLANYIQTSDSDDSIATLLESQLLHLKQRLQPFPLTVQTVFLLKQRAAEIKRKCAVR